MTRHQNCSKHSKPSRINDLGIQGGNAAVTMSDEKVTTHPIDSFADDEIVTFKQLAEVLDAKANTISARWFVKVLQAYDGLDCPELKTETNKLTGFGAKAIARYKAACIDGGMDFSQFKKQVQSEFERNDNEAVIYDAELVEEVMESSEVGGNLIFQPQNYDSQVSRGVEKLQDSNDKLLTVIAGVIHSIEAANAEQNQIQQVEKQDRAVKAFTKELLALEEEDKAKKKARELYAAAKEGKVDLSAIVGG